MYPGGKTKAVTFSYDDGIVSDKKLVPIFNVLSTYSLANGKRGVQRSAFVNPSSKGGTKAILIAERLVDKLVAVVGMPHIGYRCSLESCLRAGEGDAGHIGSITCCKRYSTAKGL